MQDKIYDLLVKSDDIEWQTIIYELVKTEQMNPWDIDVSELTKKYIEIVKHLKEANLKLSGKVLLASAILLKMKSNQFLSVDIAALDALLREPEQEMYDEYEDLGEMGVYDMEAARRRIKEGNFGLIPKTPQPRQRKVSIFDLVNALEKAMEVRKRRVLRTIPNFERKLELPRKGIEIGKLIKEIYLRIGMFFKQNKQTKLTFEQLSNNTQDKKEKVMTFIPLLHLANQRRIDLEQREAFGEIEIRLLNKKIEKQNS
jgi:segregation and condensation protein A